VITNRNGKSLRCFTVVRLTSRHWGDSQIEKESFIRGERVEYDPKGTKRTIITNWKSTRGRSHRNRIPKMRVRLTS